MFQTSKSKVSSKIQRNHLTTTPVKYKNKFDNSNIIALTLAQNLDCSLDWRVRGKGVGHEEWGEGEVKERSGGGRNF